MTAPPGGRGYAMAAAFARLCVAVLAALAAGRSPVWAAETGAPEAVASYRIDARLDAERREVSGRAVLHWRNPSAEPVPDLCLHFYLNAFANNRTTLLSAARREAERWLRRFPDPWGGLDVTAVRSGGADLTARLAFVQPDDSNPDDRTLARLALPRPVGAGETIEVEFDFVARLPRLFMRAGHAAPFFFVAQWFPKLGVFQDGRWNCHQYHRNSEFFADFGSYDVTLTVPADYVVGHTGVAEAERDNGDGTKTIAVRAEGVHDFAWTADPRFRVVEETIDGVRVRLLVQPHHLRQAPRYLESLRAAMARYAAWFGPYPYPVLTVVDPGPGGLAAGGMEYPMLITVATAWWMPAGLRLPEFVTVHEFGHQYWYGMVASDEVNEAWLDEGVNAYVEGRVMDEAYGPAGSYLDLFGLQADATALQRFGYLGAGRWDPIARSSYRMLDNASYRSATYDKTALALRTLDRLLGGERLRAALGDYFRRWRFRHPTGADWRAAVQASVGEDLGWFFAQVLDGTGELDYAVARVDVQPVPPLRGPGTPDEAAAEPARFRSEVVIERRGEVRMPVDIVVVFDDGSQTRESWDGQERWHRLDVTSTHPVAYAVVDPDGKLPLDVDRVNNSRLLEPGTRGIVRLAGRWGLWLQGALLGLTGL